MRFYTQEHRLYCGIDLHARTMYLCILSQSGEVVYHRDLRAEHEPFLTAIAPYRDDIVVCVECIFTWYWLADLCAHENIPFVLGHALYMKAIHGGKTKNDRIDSRKIAGLLRSGMIPMAYVYPPEMRATRDLLRRRNHFVRNAAFLGFGIELQEGADAECKVWSFLLTFYIETVLWDHLAILWRGHGGVPHIPTQGFEKGVY